MIFDDEKKNKIIIYLLEKIEQKIAGLTKKVSDEFGVTQNTVYTYLAELEHEGAIIKLKRGEYELVNEETVYILKRSLGELKDEDTIYLRDIKKHLGELPSNVLSIWHYVLSEMINNVIDHSNCENLQITIRRNRLNTTVMLEDDGVGLFNKIRNYFSYDTDEDVTCELFKGKLTTDKANHSGEGIFFSSRLMDYFEIISGNGRYIYDNINSGALSYEECPGTRYVMKLSNYSKKTAKEIFDIYADVDDGFIKTSIPLKNLFDGNLVSRSQAKRICNRLEEFETVNLDFQGVDWIGQGFADQIFRIFVSEHPEIKIIPLNMNDDVMKMYRHVLKS